MPAERLRPFALKLNGKQRFMRLLGASRKSAVSEKVRSGFVILNADESVGWHNTEARHEIIIILKGKAKVHYGAKGRFNLSDNSFVYLPPQTLHNVENTGRRPLKYVYITSNSVR